MFETVRYHPKGESLNLCLRLLRRGSVGEHAGQVNDFCDPTTVFLLFNLDAKVHILNSTLFPHA